MRESDLRSNLGHYLARLDDTQRNSFAPLDTLIENALDGLDVHILALRKVSELRNNDLAGIHGLIVFNQDSNSFKVQADRTAIKVTLHHISATNKDNRNEIFDQALKYIWKHTHCSAIRLNLYHVKGQDGSFMADPEIKMLLKARKFKWKTVKNDVATGHRSEVLEVQNHDH